MKKIFILIMALVVSSCMAEAQNESQIKIYYIPIGTETYVPMGMEKIEGAHLLFGAIDLNNSVFKMLEDLISKANEGGFNGGNVRVKIIYPDNQVIYIDNEGGVNSSVFGYLQLSGSDLGKIKNYLNKLTKLKIDRKLQLKLR